MSHHRFAAVIALCVALLGLGGCHKDKSESANGSAAVAGLSPIEIEAGDAVMAEVKNHWTQAADGWISAYNVGNQFAPNYQRQLKEIAVVNVETIPLDESDKMNGVEWVGNISFKKTPCREMGDAGPVMSDQGFGTMRTPKQWSQWVDLTPEMVQAQKIKGKWQVHQNTMLMAGTKPQG